MLVRIGVDVGGTNTDAVVLHNNDVIGFAKKLTTENVTSGVISAVTEALNDAQNKSKGAEIRVLQVNIGTTHFVNAVIQRRHLVPVSVIRIGGTDTASLPPYTGFPPDLEKVLKSKVYLVDGGFEVTGNEVIRPMKEPELVKIIGELKDAGIKNVVLSGVFSPINAEHENRVAELFETHFPECSVTKSHLVAGIGIIERENAAILNEALRPLCKKTVAAFREALNKLGLTCPFYLSQNDGTLISAEKTLDCPVHTFASGPTNSMRGAATLSGIQNAVVADIGGTTTDVGMLVNGFPRQANTKVKVGNVSTNFRMPDVFSFGLGGGSIVQKAGAQKVQVGPDSVGFRLMQEAMVFGGKTHVTATDIAVAAGLYDIGQSELVKSLPKDLMEGAISEIRRMLEDSVDQIKLERGAIPVILVGGGSILVDTDLPLEGASEVIKPPHYGVANAVGAALAQVTGNVDEVVILGDRPRDQVIKNCEEKAIKACVREGADPKTVQIYDKTDIALAYLPGNVTRIKVKAIGDLLLDENQQGALWKQPTGQVVEEGHVTASPITMWDDTSDDIHAEDKEPTVDPVTGEWHLSEWDVECITIGAGVLGCGGGGSITVGRLRTLKVLQQGKAIRVISPPRMAQLLTEDTDRLACVAFFGAPTVMNEKISSGTECISALRTLKEKKDPPSSYQTTDDGIVYVKGQDDPVDTITLEGHDTTIKGVLCIEIGGLNSTEPMIVAAELGLPVVDMDFMGRAFPELQMCTCWINGLPSYPTCGADCRGRYAVVNKTDCNVKLENFLRNFAVDVGCSIGLSFLHFDKTTILERGIPNSLSRAWRLGRAILRARREKTSPVEAILNYEGGKHIANGKVVDVERTTGGFARGTVIVDGTGDYKGSSIRVDFKNENLVVMITDPAGTQQMVACVPDLIAIVDVDSGEPILTEDLRYGLRVSIIRLACHNLWRNPKALEFVGPKAFGYDETEVVYQPFGEMGEHEPVPLQ